MFGIRSATIFALTAWSAAAFAYDFTCYPETIHDPAVAAPHVGFMLDQSGSMGSSTDPTNPSAPTRWAAARTAILEVVEDYYIAGGCSPATRQTCDRVRFGIGRFSWATSTSWIIPAQEDAHSAPFSGALPVTQPGGATATGAGARVMVEEDSLKEADRINVGVLITDGRTFPSNSHLATRLEVVGAVRALCDGSTRTNPLVTYVVAFGLTAESALNDLYAAAGGTGRCVDPSANDLDICAMTDTEINNLLKDDVFNGAAMGADLDETKAICSGHVMALYPSDLKNQIASISSEAACTFPLEIPPNYPGDAASVDPQGTNVSMNHRLYGSVQLGYIGDCDSPSGTDTEASIFALSGDAAASAQYRNEGWCFNDQTRLTVRVTGRLCDEIGARDVQTVATQVACPCQFTGQSCTLTGLDCVDTAGNVHLCTNEQLLNMPCSAGEYICINGVLDVCEPVGAIALPEICNGVDDNCDGIPDNVDATETEWTDPTIADGKHCNFSNTCQCPDGQSEAITISGGIPALLDDNYTGVCVCGSSLEFEDESTPSGSESGSGTESSAACASLGGFQHALAIWGVLLGFVMVSRRRRK